MNKQLLESVFQDAIIINETEEKYEICQKLNDYLILINSDNSTFNPHAISNK